jgi:hypothetical protein
VAHEALVDERLEESMGRANRKSTCLPQLAQADLFSGRHDLLEEAERPLDRLDTFSVAPHCRGDPRGFSLIRHADNRMRLDAGRNVL